MTDYSEQDVVITPELIKLVTGQFDVGSVLNLPLCGLGIKQIEGLEGCVRLQQLDLSSNKLQKIHNVTSLGRCLLRLDLRFNALTRLEGLQVLEMLECVRLQGNNISDLDTVLGLAGLSRLRALHLQDAHNANANPVCSHPKYRDALVKKLPRLGNLDGEYFLSEECRPRLVCDGESQDILIPQQQHWLPRDHLATASFMNADTFLNPPSRHMKNMVGECAAMLEKADALLQRQVEIRASMDE